MIEEGNKLRRGFSFMLAALFICCCIVKGGTTVSAATVNEQESNDTMDSATSITIGDTIEGNLSGDDWDDYFKVTLSTSGKLSINLESHISILNLCLYNSDGEQLYARWEAYLSDGGYRDTGNAILWNEISKTAKLEDYFYLTSGTYYFRFKARGFGDYSFITSFESSNETIKESGWGINNSIADASLAKLGKTYTGQIGRNDSDDYYKVILSSSGTFFTDFDSYDLSHLNYIVYDESGNNLFQRCENYLTGGGYRDAGNSFVWNEYTRQIKENLFLHLNKGTYFVRLKRNGGNVWNNGTYNLKFTFESAKESFTETGWGTNNDMQTANSIKIDKSYNGAIATNDETDYYKLTIDKAANYKVSYKSYFVLNYYIYNSNGEEIYSRANQNKVPWNDISKNVTLSDSVFFNKGTYYLRFTRDGTGFYSFKVASPVPTSVKLNKTSCKLAKGTSTTLKATVYPSEAFDKKVTWSTSNNKVATVDGKGKVKAIAKGTATITVTTSNKKKATCKVTVNVPATKVKLNKATATLKTGMTLTLKATKLPKDTTDKLIWTSSNKKVATVKNGKVTARKAGTVTITVKTTSGKTAKCMITVKKK